MPLRSRRAMRPALRARGVSWCSPTEVVIVRGRAYHRGREAGMFSLDGQKVVIIGGSYGMGYATAEMAVEAGAQGAIAARDAGRLEEASRKLEGQGGPAG